MEYISKNNGLYPEVISRVATGDPPCEHNMVYSLVREENQATFFLPTIVTPIRVYDLECTICGKCTVYDGREHGMVNFLVAA